MADAGRCSLDHASAQRVLSASKGGDRPAAGGLRGHRRGRRGPGPGGHDGQRRCPPRRGAWAACLGASVVCGPLALDAGKGRGQSLVSDHEDLPAEPPGRVGRCARPCARGAGSRCGRRPLPPGFEALRLDANAERITMRSKKFAGLTTKKVNTVGLKLFFVMYFVKTSHCDGFHQTAGQITDKKGCEKSGKHNQ